MIESAFYLVTRDVAQRAGLLGQRYVTKDGYVILDNKDLSRVRFTADEYISGLRGVTKISNEQARSLIAQNGYSMNPDQPKSKWSETAQVTEEPVEETIEQEQEDNDAEADVQEEHQQEQEQETTEPNNEQIEEETTDE